MNASFHLFITNMCDSTNLSVAKYHIRIFMHSVTIGMFMRPSSSFPPLFYDYMLLYVAKLTTNIMMVGCIYVVVG